MTPPHALFHFGASTLSWRQTLVKRIVFTVVAEEPTTWGSCSVPADTVPVVLTRKHWDGKATFDFVLNPPQTVKGGETIVFALSLTEPQLVETTYLGQVEIYYDDTRFAHPDRVRIDVTASARD